MTQPRLSRRSDLWKKSLFWSQMVLTLTLRSTKEFLAWIKTKESLEMQTEGISVRLANNWTDNLLSKLTLILTQMPKTQFKSTSCTPRWNLRKIMLTWKHLVLTNNFLPQCKTWILQKWWPVRKLVFKLCLHLSSSKALKISSPRNTLPSRWPNNLCLNTHLLL